MHQRDLFLPAERAAVLRERAVEEARSSARVSRRRAFRFLGWGALAALVAQWSAGFFGFFQPRRLGTFGSTVNAGQVDSYAVGDVRAINSGKFFVVRVPEGFLALWWKCPHLGCTVPWLPREPALDSDRPFAALGQFKCPCHSSQYNRYGQIVHGPATRPMDRFPLRIVDGRIFVDTGPDKAIVRRLAQPGDATPG